MIESVYDDLVMRCANLERRYPAGFPAERNGIRLGLAAASDELDEALAEWNKFKHDGDWNTTYNELLDTAAVIIRILDSIAIGEG